MGWTLFRRKTAHKDPVCGMDVDPKTAPASVDVGGRTHYFCSVACLSLFKQDPARYSPAPT